MKNFVRVFAGILLAMPCAIVEAAPHQASRAADTVWTAQNGAYRVAWTGTDIKATRIADGAQVFSFRKFALQGAATLPHEDGITTTRHHTVTVVSLAGSLLALRDEILDDVRPAAHPAGITRFWTIDLARSLAPKFRVGGYSVDPAGGGGVSALTDIVPAADVLSALSRDTVVRAAVPDPHADLDDLIAAWRDGIEGQPGIGPGRLCYEVADDVLTSFAVIGTAGSVVTVRLGLGGDGACRASFVQIGLALRIAPGTRLVGTTALRPPAGLAPLRTIDRLS